MNYGEELGDMKGGLGRGERGLKLSRRWQGRGMRGRRLIWGWFNQPSNLFGIINII